MAKTIEQLLQEKGGIRLDIGAGIAPQPGFVTMDIQDIEGVDIVQDFNVIPWNMPDECCIQAIASHVVEHIPRVMYKGDTLHWMFIEFMDEVWRVLKPDAQFALVMPYCLSPGFYQDPTHVNACNEATWLYFDPEARGGEYYDVYKPKPWKIEGMSFASDGIMEVLLRKRALNG